MQKRSLTALIAVLLVGEFATPAFADEVKEPIKSAAKQKHPRRQIASCGLYSSGTYLYGNFNRKDNRETMVRDGLGLGTSCNYNNRSRLTFGLNTEFYGGLFKFTHDEDALQGSVKVLEMGFKQSVGVSLDLHRVKIGLTLGVQQTVGNNASIGSMRIKLVGGWFDVKDLANQHLIISGDLQVLEAGLDVEFPLPRSFSIISGAVLQRYSLDINTKLDDDGRRILEALHYDIGKVERTFNSSSNFFNLHPGVKWCSKKLCTRLDVNWGFFRKAKWAASATLTAAKSF